MIEPFRGDEFGDDRDIQGQAKNDSKVAGVANKKGVNKGRFFLLYNSLSSCDKRGVLHGGG